jgi:hypothetical protein
MNLLFFLLPCTYSRAKKYKNKPARTIRTKRISRMIKSKASKNASHLLLSYIPIPSRRMSRREKQNKKRKENYRS